MKKRLTQRIEMHKGLEMIIRLFEINVIVALIGAVLFFSSYSPEIYGMNILTMLYFKALPYLLIIPYIGMISKSYICVAIAAIFHMFLSWPFFFGAFSQIIEVFDDLTFTTEGIISILSFTVNAVSCLILAKSGMIRAYCYSKK